MKLWGVMMCVKTIRVVAVVIVRVLVQCIIINFWVFKRMSMNMSIAVALGAVLFIAVFLAKIYLVPGCVGGDLFMVLLFVLSVVVVLIISSG